MMVHNIKMLALSVRNARKQRGLSQSDIAQQTGLKQATISAFERKPEATKLDTLFRILSATGLQVQVSEKRGFG